MKRSILAGALVLALFLWNTPSVQAEGGWGFSLGLRLTGDASGWCFCPNKPPPPKVWPMAWGYGQQQPAWGYEAAPGYGYGGYGYYPGAGNVLPGYQPMPQGTGPGNTPDKTPGGTNPVNPAPGMQPQPMGTTPLPLPPNPNPPPPKN